MGSPTETQAPPGAKAESDAPNANVAPSDSEQTTGVVDVLATNVQAPHDTSPVAMQQEAVTGLTSSDAVQEVTSHVDDTGHAKEQKDIPLDLQNVSQHGTSQDIVMQNDTFTDVGVAAHAFHPPPLLDGTIPLPPIDFHHIQDEAAPTLPVPHPDEHDLALGPPSSEALNNEQMGYFKLEFPDAQLYIDTLHTVFGRDTDATRRKKLGTMHHDGSQYDGMSVVSETGGIVNLSLRETRRRKKSRGAASRASSSQKGSRRNSMVLQNDTLGTFDNEAENDSVIPSARIHLKGGASSIKSTKDCTWVKLHAKEGSHGGGISREHAAIIYNFDEQAFELHIYGRNGAFLDDDFYNQGGVVNLHHGCTITISGVSMRWLLPNDGADGNMGSEAHSAMSFEFEDGRGESIAMNDSSDSSTSDVDDTGLKQETNGLDSGSEGLSSGDEAQEDIQQSVESDEDDQDDVLDDEDEAAAATTRPRRLKLSKPKKPLKKSSKKAQKEKIRKPEPEPTSPTNVKSKPAPKPEPRTDIMNDPALSELLKGIPPEMIPPRRKGPGRPPKNGIMSKREQALLLRQQKEAQKAEAIKNGTLKPGAKAKPEETSEIPGKRKYTKRKKIDGQPDENGDIQEFIEGDDDGLAAALVASRVAKEKRPPKPPRSPSPPLDVSKLTEEQLAKPAQSYVVLIHEALSGAPTQQMTLPQIYRAIERKYPYFKVKVATQGWQSSVRHNLSQHAAFKKIERDGKGWMWGLVPEVNIEKEKKRRATPPPENRQTYYQPPPQMFRPPPQGYPPYPPNLPADGRPPPPPMQYMFHPPPGHGYPPGPFPPGVPQPPPNVPLPPGAPQVNNTYQSPYTSSPSASSQPNPQAPNPPLVHHAYYPPPPVGPNGSAQGRSHGPPRPDNQFHQHSAPPHTIPFEQTQSVIDQTARFKQILLGTLKLPNAEELVDRVIRQALKKMPVTKEVEDTNTPDAGIYKALMDLLKPLREKYDEDNSAKVSAMQQVPPVAAPLLDGKPNSDLSHVPTDKTGSSHSNLGSAQAQEAQNQNQSSNASGELTEGLQKHPTVSEQPGSEQDDTKPNTVVAAEQAHPAAKPEVTPTDNKPQAVSPPLQNAERAQIFDLLQRLDPGPKAPPEGGIDNITSTNGVPNAEDKHAGPSTLGKSSATEVLHKSEEAANIVLNAMGAGTKRRHEDGEDTADEGDQPPAKRLAEGEA